MDNDTVKQTVELAVKQSYNAWAAEHPSLSAVIDRIALTDQVVTRLRDTDEYKQAVAAYNTGQSDLNLLNRLLDLIAPTLTALLAG